MKRTFIFEDQFFDLEAIRAILAKIPEIQIIDNASTVGEALAQCKKLKPDLIIADSDIYGDKSAGPNFVRTIKKILPNVRILGMTRYSECIDTLRHAGCDFVVNKSLIENDKAAVKYLYETLIPKPEYYLPIQAPKLTKEEDEILRKICDGYTEDEIAVQMGLDTRRPIRRIKDILFEKFGAINVPNLIHLAYKSGYLNPAED
jgi:DNA-binding NarL/FixJ family response regulator